MYRMKALLSLAATLLGAVLIAASAFGQAGSPDTLRVATSFLPSGHVRDAITYATCVKLFNYPDTGGPRTSQLIPEAAASFPRVSPDGRTYVIRLNVRFTRFSNGEAVTARSFKRAIDRVALLGPTELVADIVGAEDVFARRKMSLSGVVLRPGELRITLLEPDGGFVRRLASNPFCAIPLSVPTDDFRQPDGPAPSAGPYYTESAERLSLVLRRNPYYRGKRPRHSKRIAFEWGIYAGDRPFEGIATDVFEGRVDWGPLLTSRAELQEIASRSPNARLHRGTSLLYLSFDVAPGQPLADVKLRKGLAMALDRHTIAQAHGYNRALAFDHFIPPTIPGSRPTRVYALRRTEADLERARALVQPFLPLRLTLFIDNSEPESWVRHGRAIEKSLEDTGIDIQAAFCIRCNWVDPRDVGIHLRFKSSYTFDPADFLRAVSGAADERVAHAVRLPEPARSAALGRLDIELARDSVPGAALSILTQRDLFSARIGCLEFHRLYSVSLGALCLRKPR
jgi:ABC-type oligopeptide transport system substrate-binding subunit